MATILYDKTIFGPIHSRRLGISLGINLMPTDKKICTFDCLYCECGFNNDTTSSNGIPTVEAVHDLLRDKLNEMKNAGELPDVITFAGNGEPTLHPDFDKIIDNTIAIRDELCPNARIAVLSNASRLGKENVVKALKKVDDNILKLDAADTETVNMLDRPNYQYSIEDTIRQISQFGDNLAIQTMFAKWMIDGVEYDNSTDEHVESWLKCIKRINPPRVMIYTIDRETPLKTMAKVDKNRLDHIAERTRDFVSNVSVSY